MKFCDHTSRLIFTTSYFTINTLLNLKKQTKETYHMMHNINMSSEILTVAKGINVGSYKIQLFTQRGGGGGARQEINHQWTMFLPSYHFLLEKW